MIANLGEMLTLDFNGVTHDGSTCSAKVFEVGHQAWEIVGDRSKPADDSDRFPFFAFLHSKMGCLKAWFDSGFDFRRALAVFFQ